MEAERKIFSLSDLARSLRSVIERAYSGSYWIKAEIAKLNLYPRSGHCYPDLVEKTGDQILAQMRSTIWAGEFKTINQKFIEVTGEPLREGIQILFLASVTFHPVYGFSLQIQKIEPSFTLGQMALEKLRTIDRLKSEGVFDINKNLPSPLLPRRLAVISVETSKGYHDWLKILSEHQSEFTIWHHLFPALLQGDKAVETITASLREIKKNANLFDMAAIIRGGGGDVGLNCYDHYLLAREIATFPLPVITGIGHATNQTISEMVAWQNKVTPTDVGYFIVNSFAMYSQRIREVRKSVLSRSRQILLTENHRLRKIASLLGVTAQRSFKSSRVSLEQNKNKLIMASLRFLEKHNKHLQFLLEKVKLLRPEEVLKRGYSITALNGRIIKNAKEVKPGDHIVTTVHEGSFESIVK
ncbi:MAG TPA: exodeoxyribonuclease VII large subunit [Bacteroidales bacterium]|nr:exodeoxyribonuclease VII large subunit [Bacteroidales bacterium]